MSEPTYVEQLRTIRDRIGEELQHVDWQEWEAQARRRVQQDPVLTRLINQVQAATEPDVPTAR